MGILSRLFSVLRPGPKLAREQIQPTGVTLQVMRAATTATAWSGLTPARLASILRDAATGAADDFLALAEEMEERDLHYASVLQTRRLAAVGLPRVVVEAADSGPSLDHAELVRTVVDDARFGDLLRGLFDAFGKGYSVVEVLWTARDGRWLPGAYKWRDPRLFRYDADTLSVLRVKGATADQDRDLDPGHFVCLEASHKTGAPIRGGLARLACVAAMIKSYSIKDWLAFAEVYGQPLRVGRYPVSATEDDVSRLYSAVSNLGTDFAAVLPESSRIELVSAHVSGGGEVFARLAEYVDAQISKAVLGQTMTTDNGSSLSQAQVHEQVRQDLLAADGAALADVINQQLVRPLIDVNFGEQSVYPRLVLRPDRVEDAEALSRAVTPLVTAGLRVSASEIRERLRLREPEEGEETLGGAPASVVPESDAAPAARVGAEKHAAKDEDLLDRIATEQLRGWQQQVDPITDPIVRLAEQCSDRETFVRRLSTVLRSDSDGALARAVATAAYEAHALGRDRDEVK
jgi:phage gp29-like protein